MYVSKIVLVPSDNVRSQVWSPTLASVVSVFAAASVAVWTPAPASERVIHVGHEPPLFLANVTSADSSSVAVRVTENAASSTTVPSSATPPPSLDRIGASFTAVTVITNVSDAESEPSDVVHVIPYVLSASESAAVSEAAVAVPPRVA